MAFGLENRAKRIQSKRMAKQSKIMRETSAAAKAGDWKAQGKFIDARIEGHKLSGVAQRMMRLEHTNKRYR